MTNSEASAPARAAAGRKWDDPARAIVDAFAAGTDDGTPVYLRLKHTVRDLVVDGALAAGAQLPPEQWLARATGVSLGTVQKALNALHADGLIERRQGHGTYVSEPRRPMTELWHFRFFDPRTGGFAPIYSRLLSRRIVAGRAVPRVLPRDPAGFVEIERAIDIAGEATCHSRLYLGASHFAPLMAIEPAVFDNVNLKQIFAGEFGRPTLDAVQRVRATAPPRAVARVLGHSGTAPVLALTVIAHSHGGPYSFQEVHIPHSRFELDVSPMGEERAAHPNSRTRLSDSAGT